MATFKIKYVLNFAITMAMLDCTNCQLAAVASGIPQIISLLENVTDSSATVSNFLPRLASLLRNHKDMQIITNLLQDQQEKQDLVVALLENQRVNNNQTTSPQTEMKDTLTEIANSQSQMTNTQTRIANTQTQMASTMNQVASLLQMQSHQLNNMTGAMTTMVSLLENQQEILQNMSQSLPLVLKQQENQIELLNRLPPPPPTSPPPPPPRDCSDIAAQGYNTSRPYTITPQDGMGSLTVYCDMQTAGGGWTVFQRRYDGSVDFYLGWNEYEQGFGSPDGEHWMALREIHRLTRNGRWTLRIDMENFDGTTEYAEYESFQLGDAASHYTLSIGSYSGNGYDELSYHNNQPFTTKDRDHDARSWDNCAQSVKGAWWYKSCYHSNLNGLYLGPSGYSGTGMVWYGYDSKKKTEIKIKRIQ